MTIDKLFSENQEKIGWKSTKSFAPTFSFSHISTQIESCCHVTDEPRAKKMSQKFKSTNSKIELKTTLWTKLKF